MNQWNIRKKRCAGRVRNYSLPPLFIFKKAISIKSVDRPKEAKPAIFLICVTHIFFLRLYNLAVIIFMNNTTIEKTELEDIIAFVEKPIFLYGMIKI